MTIVDAHHHLWDPAVGAYPWMTGDFAALRRRYDFADLQPHLRANGVSRTIVVQVRADMAETRELLELSDHTPAIVGVVGWVDLTASNVGDQIDTLRAGPGGHRLVGLRHGVADEPDPRWLLRADVDDAMRAITARKLAFDLEITDREAAAADTLADRHPELRLVVDHGAKPPIAAGWSAHWANGITALSRHRNVWCKLSGLVTEASWTTWTPADLQPYIDHLVGAFGAQRLMFGSDWPVCELAADYGRVLGVATQSLASLDDVASRNIFCHNAIAFYFPDGIG